MIVAQKAPRPALTLLACTLFAAATGLSLTREVHAQPPAAVSPSPALTARRTIAPAAVDDPANDGLATLFPTGIVATVGDRVITMDEVRREIAPLLPFVRQGVQTPDELKKKVLQLQNSVIAELIQRILLIKEFPTHTGGEKTIAAETIEAYIADTLRNQFDNDQAKLLAYLQARNQTMSDYRKSVEEEIIFHYMKGQLRPTPPAPLPASQGGKTHLRLIQLSRAAGETDDALRVRANAVLTRFKTGEKFEDLARELSNDTRKSQGGDWGWLGASDVRMDFREAFSALRKGDVGAPIIITEGAFLLYADDRK